MNHIDRVYFALRRIEDKSVACLGYADWYRMVRPDGAVTELEELPATIRNPSLEASTVVALASGVANPDPGCDVLRYDPVDAPFVLNLDHYRVVENLHLHEVYQEVLKIAKVEDTPELRFELQNNVYVIKEPPNDYHWLKDFPEFVLQAKKRAD
jgi:hypothetical protein